jgi:hypothetical protein
MAWLVSVEISQALRQRALIWVKRLARSERPDALLPRSADDLPLAVAGDPSPRKWPD